MIAPAIDVRSPGFQLENVTVGPVAASSGAAGADLCQARADATWTRGVEGQRRADLGDGCYLNPIFPGDHPDPSVLKDGDDYYMTFSSFDAYPGLVVWHSRDLVNWQPIGPALFRTSARSGRRTSSSTAGATTSTFPRARRVPLELRRLGRPHHGSLERPIDLKLPLIDPGHAVGEDGKRYLFLSAAATCRSPTTGSRRRAR